MGRAPCCDKANVKKGPWSPEEDAKLKEYIEKLGTGGNWIALPQKAGLKRCGKSCRLRWLNYLRPNIKHGDFTEDEDRLICSLYANIGSRWSIIANQLSGRTDNDIKNYWNTKLKKKLMGMGMGNPSCSRINKPQQQILQPTTLYTIYNNNYNTINAYNNYNSIYNTNISCNNSFTATSTNTNGSMLQQSQESYVGNYNQQIKDGFLLFGGDQASCSSSDASCNNNNEQLGFQSNYSYNNISNINGVLEEEHNLPTFSSSTSGVTDNNKNNNNGSLLWGGESNYPLDYYGLEEIKQLISSSSSCNNNNEDNSNSLLFDENMTEERVVMY